VQRERRVSKSNLSKVEGVYTFEYRVDSVLDHLHNEDRTLVFIGRVWSVSFPLMGTDTPHQREGRPYGAPCAHVSKNQKGVVTCRLC
jgi:hypothetical protein